MSTSRGSFFKKPSKKTMKNQCFFCFRESKLGRKSSKNRSENRVQDGMRPFAIQKRPKKPPRRPRAFPRRPKRLPRLPKTPQDAPKMPPKRPKTRPRRPKTAPRGAQKGLRRSKTQEKKGSESDPKRNPFQTSILERFGVDFGPF